LEFGDDRIPIGVRPYLFYLFHPTEIKIGALAASAIGLIVPAPIDIVRM